METSNRKPGKVFLAFAGICILALNDNLGVTGVDSVQDLTKTLITHYLKGFTDN